LIEKSFTGGDQLKKKLEELAKNISKSSEVKTGFLEGSTEPGGASTALVASCQEFGTQNTKEGTVIPPRPFFRPMVAAGSKKWGEQLGNLLKHNEYDAEKSLALMGENIVGELRQSIVDVTEPALSPITLMLRKMRSEYPNFQGSGTMVAEAAARVAAGEDYSGQSTKPLVDTGHMLASVGYQVDAGQKVLPFQGGAQS